AFYERQGYQPAGAVSEPLFPAEGAAATGESHNPLTPDPSPPERERGEYVMYEKLFPGREKVVAIHQPNYFPWAGYFHKMMHCNDFIFLDDALVSNNSFT